MPRAGPPADNPKRGQRSPPAESHVLRLYVSGTTPLSVRAIVNVRKLCDTYLAGRYDLVVVDIVQEPQAAIRQQIVAAPTLVQERPLPVRRYIGDMSRLERIVERLGLTDSAPSARPETRGT